MFVYTMLFFKRGKWGKNGVVNGVVRGVMLALVPLHFEIIYLYAILFVPLFVYEHKKYTVSTVFR